MIEFSTLKRLSREIFTPTTIHKEPICIPPQMDESYMRESSPIETPGAILLEIIIADAVMSDAVGAGIEHKCLLPTSSEPTPLR